MMIRATAFAILMLGSSIISQAGSLAISPVRVDLTSRKSNTIVQVTNSGDSAVTIQVHAAKWSMEGPENTYAETNDFIVNPPVFRLQPEQKQMIRIGIRNSAVVGIERSYRLILEEVPKPAQAGTVAIVLNVSLPIFLQPLEPVAPSLIWRAALLDDGGMQLTVTNDGSAHDRINNVAIETDGGRIQTTISGYVLPGLTRTFTVHDEHLRPAKQVVLAVVTEKGKVNVPLTPDRLRKD